MLAKFLSVLAIPGRQVNIVATASQSKPEDVKVAPANSSRRCFISLDRALNKLVVWSGSWPVFVTISASVVVWALLGITFSDQTTWQVFISDYQAILTYFFDSLLMRQQLRDFKGHLAVYARLQSRMITHDRLLRLASTHPSEGHAEVPAMQLGQLPKQNRVGRALTKTADVTGHIITVGMFWVGIVIWLAFGPSLDWSDTWQLYMNSATSALMVILFAFLALCREQHSTHSAACLAAIEHADIELETSLRTITGDHADHPTVTIASPSAGLLQRAINYYAVLISMLVGIVILIAVVLLWLALGPIMQFGDNWWLFIGTYAGLIGMIDGLVMRNIDEQLVARELGEFERIAAVEEGAMAFIALDVSDSETYHDLEGNNNRKTSLTQRVSLAMTRYCAHRYAVLAGLIITAVLIIAASCLEWSFTGQLICNVPPSIIESFFMIILITGHNERNARKQRWLERVYAKRCAMLAYIRLESVQEK